MRVSSHYILKESVLTTQSNQCESGVGHWWLKPLKSLSVYPRAQGQLVICKILFSFPEGISKSVKNSLENKWKKFQ